MTISHRLSTIALIVLLSSQSHAETEADIERRQAALKELLKNQPPPDPIVEKRYKLAVADKRMEIWTSPKCAGLRYVLEKDPKAELLDKIEEHCIKPWARLLLLR